MLAAENDGILGSFMPGGGGKQLNQVTREFTEKLDRAESEKKQLEEKLEAVAVSWKRERRQLSDEIEKFRKALARTSTAVTDTDGLQRRLEETIRYNQQLELKCEEQAVAKDSERKHFQSRIEDLESQIVEWMDRSHNTYRTVQSGERKMEAEFASHKRVVEIESERKLRSEQVKSQKIQRVLESEIDSLRKTLAAVPADKPSLIQRLFGPRR